MTLLTTTTSHRPHIPSRSIINASPIVHPPHFESHTNSVPLPPLMTMKPRNARRREDLHAARGGASSSPHGSPPPPSSYSPGSLGSSSVAASTNGSNATTAASAVMNEFRNSAIAQSASSSSSASTSSSAFRRFAQLLFVSFLVSTALYAASPYATRYPMAPEPGVLRASSPANEYKNNNNDMTPRLDAAADDDGDVVGDDGNDDDEKSGKVADEEVEDNVVDRDVPLINENDNENEQATSMIPSPNHDQEDRSSSTESEDAITTTPPPNEERENEEEGDGNANNEVEMPTESTNKQQQLRRRVVCVASTNLRTASIFSTKILERHGSAFDYQVKEKCISNELAPSQPVVKMFYQKFLAERPASQTELIRKSTDFVFVMGDEYCKMPAHFRGVHGRQFFSLNYVKGGDEGEEQENSAETEDAEGGIANRAESSSSSFPMVYLPLGPRYEFKPVDETVEKVPTFEERRYLLNLIVSPTSNSRKRLAQSIVQAFKSGLETAGSARRAVNRRKEESDDGSTNNEGNDNGDDDAAFDAQVSRRSDGKERAFVHVTSGFAANASEAKSHLPPSAYRAILLNSKFTLCPAGHNPESYRIFEAVEAGSIPVVALDAEYRSHPCKEAFKPLIDSGAPFVFLKSWDEVATALPKLAEDLEWVKEKRTALKAWYKSFWGDVTKAFECEVYEGFRKRRNERKKRRGGKKAGEETFDDDDSNNNEEDDDAYVEPDCGSGEDVEEEQSSSRDRKKKPANNKKQQLAVVSSNKQPNSRAKLTPLVTGCGRSGTLTLAHYLNSLEGVKAVHEKMAPNAVSVSWLYAVPDADVYPWEGRRDSQYRRLVQAQNLKLSPSLKSSPNKLFGPVVHLVRHPLKVISSLRRCFCGRGTRSTPLGSRNDKLSWRFVESHIKFPKKNLPLDSLLRAMTYWYAWNAKVIPAIRTSDNPMCVEDLNPKTLVEALGLELTTEQLAALPTRLPNVKNTHVSPLKEKEALPDATWADLRKESPKLASRIFQLAKTFGYETKFDSLNQAIAAAESDAEETETRES